MTPLRDPWTVRVERQHVVSAGVLVLAACLLLWPVTMGLAGAAVRAAWLLGAAVAVLLVEHMLGAWIGRGPLAEVRCRPGTCAGIAVLCGALLWAGTRLPPLAFSDELTIMLPGFSAAHLAARAAGWPALIAAVVGLLTAAWWCMLRWNARGRRAVVACCAVIGLAIALSGRESGLALRYPPLVHVLQTLATILTGGDLAFLRAPNVLWTALLWCALLLAPGWTRLQRAACLAGIVLGPLGWTYRVVLYQVCGELTLGIAAILLTHRILADRDDRRDLGALLGLLFGLWVLYRPTSLAVAACALLVLAIGRKWSAAGRTFLTIAPIALIWLTLSARFTAQYGLLSDVGPKTGLWTALVWTPMTRTLLALPSNFHPAVLAILLGGSAAACLLGRREDRMILAIAWLFGIANAAPQQVLAGEMFHGVARLNALLLLPLGLTIGVLVGQSRVRLVAGAALLTILFLTPWNLARYTQELRAAGADIIRTPPEGYIALALPAAMEKIVAETRTFAVVGPQLTLLDAFVADGRLTPAERETVLARGAAWTPDTPTEPVVIQAPIATTYRPNLSPEEESRLHAARAWALARPHERIIVGLEEALIVR